MSAVIAFDQVTKLYGKAPALAGLQLTVQPGEIYGFIGPNGAGKSTAIRLMLGFIAPTSGDVRLLGLSPAADSVAIKRRTGYVGAEAFLYPDMRVSELFRFVAAFHGHHDPATERRLVQALEIDVKKRFEELSFGNRKKVSIACALLHNPELIILDEPSNGLDPVIRANLYALLQERQAQGATVFFSSHVLAEVQHVCSRIGLIKGGKLIREATAAEFTDIGYRKVSLVTAEAPPLDGLDGVAGLSRNGDTYQFMYSGKPDALIRGLATIAVQSIHIEEPDLESVFMHYFNHNS